MTYRDEDGIPIRAGDHITFTFGIPPTRVLARLYDDKGATCIECLHPPDVKPKHEALKSLMKHYQVWKASPARVAAIKRHYVIARKDTPDEHS